MADLSDPSASFTRGVLDVLARATEIAVQARSSAVGSLHLFLVALVGLELDFEQLDQLRDRASNEPTLLWTSVSDTEGSPVALARAVGRAVLESVKMSGLDDNLSSTSPLESFKARTRWRLRPKSRTADSKETTNSTGVELSPTPNDSFLETIKRARQHKQRRADVFVAMYHLLCGLLEDTAVKAVLDSENISANTLGAILSERNTSALGAMGTEARKPIVSTEETPSLSKYAVDLTRMAREDTLSQAIGRDAEIRQVLQSLSRQVRDSVLLIGENGVGKTSIIHGIAHYSARNLLPQFSNVTVYRLDLEALFLGASKTQYELRMKNIINDIKRSQDESSLIVLFLKELRPILIGKLSSGYKSWTGAVNFLRREIIDSNIQCISTCTPSTYREYAEKDDALLFKFTAITVHEPSPTETTAILRRIQPQHERHHNVRISDEAITVAAQLAHQHLNTQSLPASAIRLVDEACASTNMARSMKISSVVAIEEELTTISMRLQTLQRELSGVSTSVLEGVRATQSELESKRKNLILQQEMINEWWKNISLHRSLILAKERELMSAHEDVNPDCKRIDDLGKRVNLLQEALDKLQKVGPKHAHDSIDIYGRDRHIFNWSEPGVVTAESLAKIVERVAGLPAQHLLMTKEAQLSELESSLTRFVFGQPDAIKIVVEAIRISYLGLGQSNRPVASFVFIGPTGTGKRLLSEKLAQQLFGRSDSLVRLKGDEFVQGQSMSRLFQLFVGHESPSSHPKFSKRLPPCVVLVEGIEKSCPELLSLFHRIIDEGHLEDGQRRLDFRRCVIVMTASSQSNAHGKTSTSTNTRDATTNILKDSRIPMELFGLVEIVRFNDTSPYAARKMIEQHWDCLRQHGVFSNVRLELDETAKTWLISTSISSGQGSHSLIALFRSEIFQRMSCGILDGSVQPHDHVCIRVSDTLGGLSLRIHRATDGDAPRAISSS